MNRVNIIDSDVRRRARVSRELSTRGVHVEIYEDVEEFVESGMAEGLLFVSDEFEDGLPEKIAAIRSVARTVLPIVGYAEDPTPERIVSGMCAGAMDYLRWPFDPLLLREAFKRAARGDRETQKELLRSQAKSKVRDLSRREREVLALVVEGHSNKGIGVLLHISPRTVEIHRANMMQKLGAHSASDAVRIGIYAGLDEGLTSLEVRAVA